jgi:[citrate (pro-3S)-lyase] ligase
MQGASMSTYPIVRIFASDKQGLAAVDELLASEGIRRDAHLDYTCAMFKDGLAIATGSCYGNTLRCMAVAAEYQGEHLMNEVVTHLMDVESNRGIYQCTSAKYFANLGFYEVARAQGVATLMENRHNGFSSYLASLSKTRTTGGHISAIVMNANPFTNGHLHLIKTAASTSDIVHVFVLSEDASVFPFSVRKKLVIEGVAGMNNIIVHDSGPYIISSATFPSYFFGDNASVAKGHAKLDIAVFCHIAKILGITERFCGEEPTSSVTAIYNAVMADTLPRAGIKFTVIPRITTPSSKTTTGLGQEPISASTVRQLLKVRDFKAIKPLVPPTTYAYLTSPAAIPILERIKSRSDLIHH